MSLAEQITLSPILLSFLPLPHLLLVSLRNDAKSPPSDIKPHLQMLRQLLSDSLSWIPNAAPPSMFGAPLSCLEPSISETLVSMSAYIPSISSSRQLSSASSTLPPPLTSSCPSPLLI
ncbi:hypothetical protein TcWFU_008830 [Taenia crassiceps]|uniref:Uncharacterized protein n=1 Tax=Taenia crassiceps TaxID=6207 RepID=A0ABR4QIJ2_9CEST